MSEKHRQCRFWDGESQTVAWIPSWAAVEGNQVQLKTSDDPDKFWLITDAYSHELDEKEVAKQSRVYKEFSMTSLLKSNGGID